MGTKESFKRKSAFDGKHSNKKSKADEKELSSSAQKRQARKERQSQRRHADIVLKSKTLWNQLRLKSNSSDETRELVEKVMDLIRGKVKEIALQHDASRVVQAAIQFGNNEQRKELLIEICDSEGSLAEIAKVQYAHFCCLKFIKYCARDDECVKMIVKSFKGEMARLAVHSVGARIVESLFLNLPSRSTASLKQEFYGPHFSLFTQGLEGVPTLKSNLLSAKTDTQKQSAVNFVKDILMKGMTKSFHGYTFFQELFAEFVDAAEPNEIRSMSSTVADHSIHMLSTRPGARVVAACAAYGTPKDRKRICKSLKGYTASSLAHRDAYLAIIRIVQVTDDTVSIHKSLLNELLTAPKNDSEGESENPLLDLLTSETGSKFFLFLLTKSDEVRMKYFDPYERSILEPEAFITENGKKVLTSKKSPDVRRDELLKNIVPTLSTVCVENAIDLLKSLPGGRVMKELYSNFCTDDIVTALVDACESSLKDQKKSGEDEESLSLFEHPTGHRAVKNLILSDAGSGNASFSTELFNRVGENLLDVAKSNRGAFVVAALLKVESLTSKVMEKLKPHKKKIKQISKESTANAGHLALLKEL